MGAKLTTYEFEHLLTPGGWLSPGWLTIDDTGVIAACAGTSPAGRATRVAGHAVPSLANLHSHAFQRAMAGLTERAGPTDDSFWTWRKVMYGFVEKLSPEDVEAIAAQLYVEMLRAGYTAVGEFHYLHHDRDGAPYGDPAEMADRVVQAAGDTGIGLTLLPVLYMTGGFGGAPAGAGQRRFVNDPDWLVDIVHLMRRRHGDIAGFNTGIAPHSLRAVPPEALAQAIDGLDGLDPDAPIHIHIAEQTKEVDDCVAWSGRRPVEWLLENAEVGPRWCLVHATHMTAAETASMAASGATAGLCPTTEANLGDGIFPLRAYLDAGGAFGVGSDSHVSTSAAEELRLLEYGQRLTALGRNIAADPATPSTGTALYLAALAGGARALARPEGGIVTGNPADVVVLDGDHPALAARTGDAVLDSHVFSGHGSPVRDVMAHGRWVVRDGRHEGEDDIAARYRRTLDRLLSD